MNMSTGKLVGILFVLYIIGAIIVEQAYAV